MNRWLMMGLFLLGAFTLSPQSAPAVPDCASCTCKFMLFWRDPSNNATYGLREGDPNDPKQSIPIPNALPGNENGPLYAPVCDKGKLTMGEKQYPRVKYTSVWEATCQVPNPPGANARYEVTISKTTDYEGSFFPLDYQHFCEE
ncbi:MAG: hypothetical protein L0241_07205 [Planctomycetia bacterium]|nr:hypothetical protein [Planctomycetia bacterium]